jgi:entericidin B
MRNPEGDIVPTRWLPADMRFFGSVATIVERRLIMMKKLMLVLVALAIGSPVLLTGCNTVQGAGRDIEKAGDKLQSEAAEHKRY